MKTRNTFVSNSSSSSFVIQQLKPVKKCPVCGFTPISLRELLESSDREHGYNNENTRITAIDADQTIDMIQDRIDEELEYMKAENGDNCESIFVKEYKSLQSKIQKMLDDKKILNQDVFSCRISIHSPIMSHLKDMVDNKTLEILNEERG